MRRLRSSLQYKMAKNLAVSSPPPSRVASDASDDSSGSSGASEGGRHEGGGLLTIMSIVYTRLVYLAFVLQLRLFCGVPYIGPALTLLLSALLHSFDSFEFVWELQGYSVAERFGLIEKHWHFFTGYGSVLAALSLRLRFWDLFVVRSVRLAHRIAHRATPHTFCSPSRVCVCDAGCPSLASLMNLQMLYPFYIANAPHARFHSRKAIRSLPVFQIPLVVFNFCLHLAAVKIGA